MAYLSEIWRYPIKSHGRESIAEIKVVAGKALPCDRLWAVVHENSTADGSQWVACHNFSRGSKAPGLMAIESYFDESTNRLTLSHPDKKQITFCPDTESDVLIDWTKDLIPDGRSGSVKLIRAKAAAMTDTEYQSITICSSSSHQSLASEMGLDLSRKRWRGNLWIDELEPWEERNWIGKIVQIGNLIDSKIVQMKKVNVCMSFCLYKYDEPNNHSAKLDQMQVHGLLPPHEHLHHLTHSLQPGQVKDKLWLKHLEETSEGVQIGRIKNWNLHPKNRKRNRF